MMVNRLISGGNVFLGIRRACVTAALLGGLAAGACGTATSPTTVSSVAVTGTAPTLGAAAQYAAVATMGDGTTQVVTSSATWTSSNTGIATVSSAGLVTAIAEGAVTIQAAYDGVTGSSQITVVP
jgi:uncharacterized protein YjdB